MKLYYTSVIIQDSENSKPWSCSMQDSCTTIKDAKEISRNKSYENDEPATYVGTEYIASEILRARKEN